MKASTLNPEKGGWRLNQISRFLKNGHESYAETLLGNNLTKKFPVRFERHTPVDSSFIADFYCEKAKLIIELDSKAQALPKEVLYSEETAKKLKEKGIKVLRLSNYEIFHDLKKVLNRIEGELRSEPENSRLLPSKIYAS